MADRTFFVRLNLDDLADQMDALDSSEERGQWLEGFRVGSRGHASRDTWTDAKLRGHAFGMTCWEQAEAFREAQSVKGRASAEARRKKGKIEPEVNRGSTTVQTAVRTEPPTGSQPIHNPESIIQETKNQNSSPPVPPKGGRRVREGAFVPPTEQEWVEYCTETWPDWHPTCAAESWAYYESVKWRMRSGPIIDWKAAARTSHGNARQWGKLQPGPASRPSTPRAPAARHEADAAWVARNAGALKPYTPKPGEADESDW